MGFLMQTTLVLTGINIALLVSLFILYLKNFLKLRMFFTVAFMIFAGLFLVHNIVYLYFSLTMMPYFAPGLDGYVLFFTLIQTLAFGLLAFVSWKH